MKKCSRCQEVKPHDEFYYLSTRGYWASRCKECEKAYQRELYAARNEDERKAYVRASGFKTRYGISMDEHAAMVKAQNGRCRICNEVDKLWVDHNHDTGKVRGLLCPGCNTTVGFLEKRRHLLDACLEYIDG